MNIRVDDNIKNTYTLQVGDALLSILGGIMYVVDYDRFDYKYRAVELNSRGFLDSLTSDTLEEMTTKAKSKGYKIYSKDDYELVLRRRDK